MFQAVSRWAVTAECWVQSRSVPVGFVVDKEALGGFFFSEYFEVSLLVSFHQRSYVFVYLSVTGTK
jgi:hypothetical protein